MAISEDRKKQLLELVGRLRDNPDLQKQILEPKPTVGGLLSKVGAPVTSATIGQATTEAMRQINPETLRETQAIEASRKGILPPSLAGIRQTPPEQLQISPTGISPTTGAVETKIERTPEAKLAETEAQAELQSDIQTRTAQKKAVQTTRQDLTNARLKIGNTFQAWLDAVSRTEQITGQPPGPLGGAFTAVLGATKANEFVNAFVGGLTEYAAAVGRIAIPGARAVRLVNLFKETAPGKFDSVASAIEQSALSFKNGLATAISRDPESYFPELMGKALGPEEFDFIQEKLNDFQETYRQGLYELAFKKNPNLLPPDKRIELEQKFGALDEEERGILQLLEEKGG